MEMGPAGPGISWDSRVKCIRDCGETLLVTLTYLNNKYAGYQYFCKKCHIQGAWIDLARSYIGHHRR